MVYAPVHRPTHGPLKRNAQSRGHRLGSGPPDVDAAQVRLHIADPYVPQPRHGPLQFGMGPSTSVVPASLVHDGPAPAGGFADEPFGSPPVETPVDEQTQTPCSRVPLRPMAP